MHHLAFGMHAGIGTAGADGFDLRCGDAGQRRFERGLQGRRRFAAGLRDLAVRRPWNSLPSYSTPRA
jgi:hypothetical protein